jgi:hypothetical protein
MTETHTSKTPQVLSLAPFASPSQVLVEEDNESGEENNGYGLHVPSAFSSELYRGVDDSTESTDEYAAEKEKTTSAADAPGPKPTAKVAVFSSRVTRWFQIRFANCCLKKWRSPVFGAVSACV